MKAAGAPRQQLEHLPARQPHTCQPGHLAIGDQRPFGACFEDPVERHRVMQRGQLGLQHAHRLPVRARADAGRDVAHDSSHAGERTLLGGPRMPRPRLHESPVVADEADLEASRAVAHRRDLHRHRPLLAPVAVEAHPHRLPADVGRHGALDDDPPAEERKQGIAAGVLETSRTCPAGGTGAGGGGGPSMLQEMLVRGPTASGPMLSLWGRRRGERWRLATASGSMLASGDAVGADAGVWGRRRADAGVWVPAATRPTPRRLRA